MKNLINKTNAFLSDEKGGESVEWVVVVGVLLAGIVAALLAVNTEAVRVLGIIEGYLAAVV